VTYTSHGHHIPFTSLANEKPTKVVRCGGVRICPACTIEALPYTPAYNSIKETQFLEHIEKWRVMDIQGKAKRLVFSYVKERLEKTDRHVSFDEDNVYIVWFAKTLQNWKALVSTTLPDGMYYEVTYNGNQREAYIDAYKKFDNVAVPDDTEEPLAQPA